MRSYINAAWSAENRRQIRSVRLYQWLDRLQDLALELLEDGDPELSAAIKADGLSVATLENNMREDSFPALLLWNLLQARMSIEQTHVTDVGAAFCRLLEVIVARISETDDSISGRLKSHFSDLPPRNTITAFNKSSVQQK